MTLNERLVKDSERFKREVLKLHRKLRQSKGLQMNEEHKRLIKMLGKAAMLRDMVELCSLTITTELLSTMHKTLNKNYDDMQREIENCSLNALSKTIMSAHMLEVEGKIEYLREVLENGNN